MTSRAIYNFQRGEPIVIGRQLVSGDIAGVAASAVLKSANGMTVPAESVEPAAVFQVEFREETVDAAAHWLFWLSASDADELAPGTYATDVRFSIDGVTVAITEPAWIVIGESVSG